MLARVLTTGQVAKICKVAPRTVSKWFDSGKLKGYRLPGSRDRRIPRENLLRFMKENGIPLDVLLDGGVMLLELDGDWATRLQSALERRGFGVSVAHDAFEAGELAERHRPTLVVMNVCTDVNPLAVCQAVRRLLPQVKIVLIGDLDAASLGDLVDRVLPLLTEVDEIASACTKFAA